MSDKLKENDWLSELDGDLREAVRLVRDTAPQEGDVRTSVDKMSLLVDEGMDGPPGQRQRENARPRFVRKVGWIAAVAAVLVIGLGVLHFVTKPKLSLAAQIARSIAAQDWVHSTETFPNGQQLETWFSPSLDVSGLSNQERVEYRDHKLGESYEFVRADQTIYRVAESEFPRRYCRWSKLATFLPAMLADGLPDQPMPQVFGIDGEDERIELLGHSIEPSAKEAELEYTIRCLLEGNPVQFVLHLDSDTMLPIRSVITGVMDGEEMTLTVGLDYPDVGPNDIYDLGVPVNTKLVNRIETERVKFLRDAVRAGAEHFDDFRATRVRHRVGDPVWWINADVELICRKDDRFTRRRVDTIHKQRGDIGPAKDVDMQQWWKQKVKTARNGPDGTPYNVVIGKDIWDFDSNERTFEKRKHGDSGYHCASLRPDVAARPAMGGSSPHLEIRIDEHPDRGPTGTILYELFISPGFSGEPVATVNRYWIDPNRGYLAMQEEMGTDKQWSDRTTVEKAAQSPSGIWYPQRIRRKCRDSDDGDVVREYIINYYVDFESEIPDRLFLVE